MIACLAGSCIRVLPSKYHVGLEQGGTFWLEFLFNARGFIYVKYVAEAICEAYKLETVCKWIPISAFP